MSTFHKGTSRCPCGRIAVKIKQNDYCCARCDEIEERMAYLNGGDHANAKKEVRDVSEYEFEQAAI